MQKILAMIFLLVLPIVHADDSPPKVYIDKGACPFECCTYRDWNAKKDLSLVDKPEGEKIVGKVNKGETVKAITGEVHVTPTPVNVVYEHEKFKIGDRVYLLTYQGEGAQKIWYKGKVSIEDVGFIYNWVNKDKSCSNPNADCWGRVLGEHKSVWWVEIQLKSGKTGWTKETNQFDNKDACG